VEKKTRQMNTLMKLNTTYPWAKDKF
jgi:hypothetical protein